MRTDHRAAIAGVLIQQIGEGWCFLVNSASFLGVVAALLMISKTPPRPKSLERTTIFSEISEGVRYVRERPTMVALLGLLTVLSAFGMPYSVLLPSFAQRQLGGGAQVYALLQIAVAVGCLAGALRLAARTGVEGLERWIVRAGVGFGICLILFSQSRTIFVAFPLLVFLGLCFMLQMASSNTLMQTLAPDELRGRVMSLHTTLFLGVFPFAGLLAGALADRVGESNVLLCGGCLMVVGVLLFGRVLERHGPESVAAAVALQKSP